MGSSAPSIAVFGGGIAGLSASIWIKELLPGARVVLFESGGQLGGKINTVNESGHVLETGPQMLVTSRQATREFCRLLGLQNELLDAQDTAGVKFVLKNNVLRKVPENIWSLVRTPLLSTNSKLRLLKEPFLWGRRFEADQSVYEFGVHHFGKEITRNLLDPVVNGVFAGDAKQMSAACAFHHYFNLARKYGSVGRGLLAGWGRGSSDLNSDIESAASFSGFREGMKVLVTRTQSKLREKGVDLRLSCGILSLVKVGDGRFTVSSFQGSEIFDGVVSAMPGNCVESLIHRVVPVPKSLRIEYAPLVVVNCGLKKSDLQGLPKGLGFWVPSGEKKKMLSCVFSSDLFSRSEGDNLAVWSLQLGGVRYPEVLDWGDSEFEFLIVRELEAITGRKILPVFCHVFRHREALPLFPVGHREHVKSFLYEVRREHPNLAFCGNAFFGSGLNNGIIGGKTAAGELAAVFAGET